MKLNKKGFSLVELLAAVTIVGILSGVAIAGVSIYQQNAREKSYEAMESSAFSAAQNYIQKHGTVIPTGTEGKTIQIKTLVDEGYLPKLEDPRVKGKYCHDGSTVKVTKTKGTGTTLDKYTYLVTIVCTEYTSSHYETDASGNRVKKPGIYFNS